MFNFKNSSFSQVYWHVPVITAALGAEVSEDHLRPALARLLYSSLNVKCTYRPLLKAWPLTSGAVLGL